MLGVTKDGEYPALVYKFDNKPIRVRVKISNLNQKLNDETKLVDLNWDSFIYLIDNFYQEDLEEHK